MERGEIQYWQRPPAVSATWSNTIKGSVPQEDTGILTLFVPKRNKKTPHRFNIHKPKQQLHGKVYKFSIIIVFNTKNLARR